MANDTNNIFFDVSREYKEIIEEAAGKKSELVISNSTFEHAILLTYHLIKNAKREVKIFTGRFDELFYVKDSRINSVINNALKRGIKFKILLEKEKPSGNKLFDDALVECKTLEKESELRNHFLISDNSGFRLEEKHGELCKSEPYLIKGRVSFNSPEVCKCLHKIFDSAFNPKSSLVS